MCNIGDRMFCFSYARKRHTSLGRGDYGMKGGEEKQRERLSGSCRDGAEGARQVDRNVEVP